MFLKDVDAVVDFSVDWTEACAGVRTLVESNWQIVPDGGDAPLALGEDHFSATESVVRLSGGRAGHVYRVGNRVSFSDGTEDERSLVVRVEER